MSVPGLAARRAASALVEGVLEKRRSLSDQAEAEGGPLAGLKPAERARAQALAAGTLRHLGRIDAVLAPFLLRRPPPQAMNALRLAVAELNVDGVPPHAAVDGAVRQVSGGRRPLAGLVNAVARRVADGGATLWDAVPEAPLPEWIAAPVAAAWGDEVATAIAVAQLRGAPLDLTVRVASETGVWAEALGAERLPTGSLRLTRRGPVSGLPGYEEGAWWVQDAAAALPARLFGDLAGRRVLDVCAAPGGKSLQLAAAGAEVTALDVSEVRLARLRTNLERCGLRAEVVAADALNWAPKADTYDAVLVDAPCTASGTIRRHPDLPHLRTGREVGSLVALQAALLARAWGWVAPGGRLVWCVCSLLPEEGEAQIARFRAAVPEARGVVPNAAALGIDSGWIDAAGGLRLRPDYWPERGGMDGFYAACLEKPAIAP